MRRAIPVLLLSAAGFVVVWRFDPTPSAAPAVAEAPVQVGSRTYTGTAEVNRHGTVQVQVVYTGDRITDVRVVQAPDSAPTRRALPILREEALQAQSAAIDTVSGATMTSASYTKSLQAAIDSRGA
jgi:uncharacterized protein with FMN-binding domain